MIKIRGRIDMLKVLFSLSWSNFCIFVPLYLICGSYGWYLHLAVKSEPLSHWTRFERRYRFMNGYEIVRKRRDEILPLPYHQLSLPCLSYSAKILIMITIYCLGGKWEKSYSMSSYQICIIVHIQLHKPPD